MSQNPTEEQNPSTMNVETAAATPEQQLLAVPEDAGRMSFEPEPSEIDPDEGDPDFPVPGE